MAEAMNLQLEAMVERWHGGPLGENCQPSCARGMQEMRDKLTLVGVPALLDERSFYEGLAGSRLMTISSLRESLRQIRQHAITARDSDEVLSLLHVGPIIEFIDGVLMDRDV